MSYNTAHTPDGRGVLIYNGEIIYLYIRKVNLSFDNDTHPDFKSTKQGNLYLTSHRIIFINSGTGNFRSISMPFNCLRNIKLEQPLFGANYLRGVLLAQPNGNWNGEANWKLTFNQGGAIDFGEALLKANDMANNYRPFDAPPQYSPPVGMYFAPPPDYYIPPSNNYNGFQPPTNVFPDRPPADTVFMYEEPPPYPGIGPDRAPHPSGIYPTLNPNANVAPNPSASAPYPAAPPNYDQVTSIPSKNN
jgi:hypothetical protein